VRAAGVKRRIRPVHGAVVKIRYGLPALVAWCWPLVIAAESSVRKHVTDAQLAPAVQRAPGRSAAGGVRSASD